MTARTITVRLTDRQLDALRSAVDERLEQHAAGDLDGMPHAAADRDTLDRAWTALASAWHAAARPRRRSGAS